ncbi:hypothetical protein BJF93_11195 [Xaviernesmea oryzae]|uniref:Uncharacterized protein n=1 Tax=Xaviernesmea oryzae TaxID=464029 RepID=A0A1Q9AVZ2_9HYPH|nr:hypothetical protein [Xaviernesmea oryzae]OLP59636.1 hypothetical protein BJF93_11195 [Xaviernesmea oryzae]SEM24360.1 hypothetical protein SAMN04487976_12438 [Xaviernesmea oryzae]
MADSDNSRTLSSGIQRNLFSLAATFLTAALEERTRANAAGVDPVLRLWHAWVTAFDDYARLTHVQQRIEREMVRTIGFPKVSVPVAETAGSVLANSEAEIDALLPGDDREGERAALKRDLAAQVAAWTMADEAEGFSHAKARAGDAAKREAELVKLLWVTRAQSILGIMAKTHAVLRHGEPGPGFGFPWSPLRGILADFLVLNGVSVEDLSPGEEGRTEVRLR